MAWRSHSLRHRRKLHRSATSPGLLLSTIHTNTPSKSKTYVVCVCVFQVVRGPCSSKPCVTGRNRRVLLSLRRQMRRVTLFSPTDLAGKFTESLCVYVWVFVCMLVCACGSAVTLSQPESTRSLNNGFTFLPVLLLFPHPTNLTAQF